jgi:hypothetical protein
MPRVELRTPIKAPIELCFDLARHIEFHGECYRNSHERAIAGKTSGLISLDESVTFRMRELGFVYTIAVKITNFSRPYHFRDEQTAGLFKRFSHDHYFESQARETIMTDVFDFEIPYGAAGTLLERLFLTRHISRSLGRRNAILKGAAETERGRYLLSRYSSYAHND